LRDGLSESAFVEFESINRIRIPNDARRFYESMDGMEDYTDLDAGWIRVWPFAEWEPVGRWDPSLSDDAFPTRYAFADHGINSWCYSIELADGSDFGSVWVYLADGPHPVSRSFDDFVAKVLDNAPELFGANGGAAV
jgi:hypothetical protein